MRKIVRDDWKTSIDCTVMGRRNADLAESSDWIASRRKRRALRARRGFLRRLKLWGR